MRKFEILRYIKRFSIFILLLAIIGSFAIYSYGKNNQQYTASAIIKYTNDGIVNGYAPDGSPLDVNEIFSTEVITRAMDLLDMDSTPEIIRSRCVVTPIISEEQQMTNEALADKGEEVTYFPDTYQINLVVDGDHDAAYARNVLDAIIESYFSIYTEEYVEQRLAAAPPQNLLESGYDYYQCVSMLSESTQSTLDFLAVKRESYPDFRSSVTGYGFYDLYEIYDSMKDYDIPELYAMIIDGPQVKDADSLKKALADEIKQSQNEEAVRVERRDYLKYLIDNFSQKNEDILNFHFQGLENGDLDQDGTSYILKDVYEGYDGTASKETTYDSLILEYVSLDKTIKAEAIKREDKQYFLNIFQNIASSSGDENSHRELEENINSYEEKLAQFHTLVQETSEELNRFISADYFRIENSVNVNEAINIKQYVLLAILFFLIVGVIGSIVLGRMIDFIEYFLYIDKKTGLPNRESADKFIEALSSKPLPDNYSVFVFKFLNLSDLTKKFGYSVGDGILKDFASLLQSMFEADGKVFNNNQGVFIGFMDQCSEAKSKAVLKTFGEYISEYDTLNPQYAIKCKGVYTTSTSDGIYSAHELISKAFAKINRKKDGE